MLEKGVYLRNHLMNLYTPITVFHSLFNVIASMQLLLINQL